jgi:hypothetical protein
MSEKETCGICLEDLEEKKNIVSFNCGHTIHFSCYTKYLILTPICQQRCMLCRGEIYSNEVRDGLHNLRCETSMEAPSMIPTTASSMEAPSMVPTEAPDMEAPSITAVPSIEPAPTVVPQQTTQINNIRSGYQDPLVWLFNNMQLRPVVSPPQMNEIQTRLMNLIEMEESMTLAELIETTNLPEFLIRRELDILRLRGILARWRHEGIYYYGNF